MGHRANFVIISNNRATIFYDQWAALGGAIAIFCEGPDACVSSATEEEEDLMDDVWCEGGYLVDFDRNVAMVFGWTDGLDEKSWDDEADGDGDDDEQRHVGYQIANAKTPADFAPIADQWPGWTLSWAHNGVNDFTKWLEINHIPIVSSAGDHPDDDDETEPV